MKIKLFLSVILVLLLAQGFNGGLSVSSLERLYLESLISSNQVVGNDLANNISSALRFGKSFEKFFGINDLLKDVKRQLPDIHNVLVVNNQGRILYSLDDSLVGQVLRESIKQKGTGDSSKYGENMVLAQGMVYTFLPLIDKEGKQYGRIGISLREEMIRQKMTSVLLSNLKILGVTTGVAALLLGLGLLFLIGPDIHQSRKRLYALIIISLFCGQLAYSYYNLEIFQKQYLNIARNKAETLSMLLKEDIEYLFQKGLNIGRLVKVDLLLSDIIKATPEINDISIQDTEKKHRYMADKSGVVKIRKDAFRPDDRPMDAYFDLMVPLYKKPKKAEENAPEKYLEGYIRVHLSREVIGKKVREIILDSFTVVVVSFLFVFELLFLLFLVMRQGFGKSVRDPVPAPKTDAWGIIRPVAFIYLLAVSLSHSFIPLKMQDIYRPLFGLSKNIILALPISVEMLAAGLSLIPVGIWLDRRGWLEPLLFGIAMSAVGAVLSGVAVSTEVYIMARSISGLGYGITWISAQGFVVHSTGPGSRAQGISNLVAGLFAGQICGAAMGGMLAERIGYSKVFYLAAGLFGILFLLSLVFMRNIHTPSTEETGGRLTFSWRHTFGFLFNRKVLSVLVFSVIPMNVCIVGVLYYLSPIYLKGIGSTQSDIGRVLMIFGLFSIYVAPFLGKRMDRSQNKTMYIFFSGVIGSVGFLAFNYLSGFGVMVLAITLLGLASSLGASAQTIYILNTRAAERIGPGKALSIQRTVDKLGQMLGPLILGGLIATSGVENGLFTIGSVYLAATVLFLILTWRGRQSTL